MTLEEFMAQPTRFTLNQYIEEPGFSDCYVRKGRKYIDGKIFKNAFVIARIVAENPGQGTFTRFLAKVRGLYPDLPVVVECVHNPRLAAYLLRNGFRRMQMDEISFVTNDGKEDASDATVD